MPIVWYSIVISQEWWVNPVFNGYFSVDGTTNLVTSFYETNNGSTNFNNDILIPAGQQDNNNIFLDTKFTDSGTLINVSPFSMDGDSISQILLHFTAGESNPHAEVAGPDEYLDFIVSTGGVLKPNGYKYYTSIISDPSCFNEGTKILCLNKNLEEEYIPIENLRKGDLVKSYKHGYRKIDLIGKNPMINNPEKWYECMYKMEKNNDNGLIEDLIVTGGHAILVNDLGNYKEENDKIFGSTQIDDKYLLLSAVSNDFVKLENINVYTYYHFILENNGNDDERFGVWANGILTETPSKKQFTNHKYTLL